MRELLGLPRDGDKWEVALVFAQRAGLNEPSEESTVNYLAAVVDCLRDTLLRQPGYLFDPAEAAHSVLGCAREQVDPKEEPTWRADLGVAGSLQSRLAIFLASSVIPKMARAQLIEIDPPPEPE